MPRKGYLIVSPKANVREYECLACNKRFTMLRDFKKHVCNPPKAIPTLAEAIEAMPKNARVNTLLQATYDAIDDVGTKISPLAQRARNYAAMRDYIDPQLPENKILDAVRKRHIEYSQLQKPHRKPK